MAEKIRLENKELIILFEIDDSEYSKITFCLDEKGEKVLISNNKIITEKSIIDKINKKYSLESPYKGGKTIIIN